MRRAKDEQGDKAKAWLRKAKYKGYAAILLSRKKGIYSLRSGTRTFHHS